MLTLDLALAQSWARTSRPSGHICKVLVAETGPWIPIWCSIAMKLDIGFSLNRGREHAPVELRAAASNSGCHRNDGYLGVLVHRVAALRSERNEVAILVRTELQELAVQQVECSVRGVGVTGEPADSAVQVDRHV